MTDERRKTVMEKNCGCCRHWCPLSEEYFDMGECNYPLPESLEEYVSALLMPDYRGTRCPVWAPKEKEGLMTFLRTISDVRAYLPTLPTYTCESAPLGKTRFPTLTLV